MELEPVIGLEIHVQLKTKSKMFCSCDNTGESQNINATVCEICLGHPGTLPVANKHAIELAVKSALSLNCKIAEESKFDRKHYFYPDLPKGYQISQFDQPFGIGGHLLVKSDRDHIADAEPRPAPLPASEDASAGEGRSSVPASDSADLNGRCNARARKGFSEIRLNRLHLEEDAAKLIHPEAGNYSIVDFNRGGTPLMEIVTEPDIRTPKEAGDFLRELRLLMRTLNVSDADMEKGHLRCDANISLRQKSEDKLYPKTEIKNLNSFKAVEKALEYEIKRQTELWKQGNAPEQQTTRGWDQAQLKTIEHREKESAHDYRYFPEPDIPPFELTKEYVKEIKAKLPECPQNKRFRFIEEYSLRYEDADIVTSDSALAEFFEEAVSELRAWLISLETVEGSEQDIWDKHKAELSKLTANWLVNKLGRLVNDSGALWSGLKITPEDFAELITLIFGNKVNSTAGQAILEEMFMTGTDPSLILEEKGLAQMDDESELEIVAKSVIKGNPDVAEQYKRGKENSIQFLVGQVMKKTKGKANPQAVLSLLKKMLNS